MLKYRQIHLFLRKNMIKAEIIEDLTAKIESLLPQDIKSMGQEFQSNLKTVLTAGLKKADLVTREEFEVQKAVLAKTRAKLEALEQKLTEISEK